MDLESGVCLLEVSDESCECGLFAQVFEMRIDPEERPARKPGVDAPFEPRHRLVRVPEDRIDAGNVVVGVVRVAEGTRGIQRLTNTLECEVGSIATRVRYALKRVEEPRAGFPLTLENKAGGQPKRSWIKISQIRTLAVDRIGPRFARASEEELARVLDGLNEILA